MSDIGLATSLALLMQMDWCLSIICAMRMITGKALIILNLITATVYHLTTLTFLFFNVAIYIVE